MLFKYFIYTIVIIVYRPSALDLALALLVVYFSSKTMDAIHHPT